MSTKSFLFVGSWMQPLKALPLQERWNVMEAIVEYSTSATLSKSLTMVENIAFGFIRNEIDRMNSRRSEVGKKRRAAAASRWNKEHSASKNPDAMADDYEHTDGNECKCMQTDAPYHIESSVSKSKSVSESKPESEKKSSTSTTGMREGGNAGKEIVYDDSQLLPRFFDISNQAKIEALAMKHHVQIDTLKSMAEEITMQWALTDKTHGSYHDAASHLVFALADKIGRERKSRLQAIADGGVSDSDTKGMLGIGEYIDSEGRRTYNGVDFIPNDAPPRPGKAFYWNAATYSWDDIQ